MQSVRLVLRPFDADDIDTLHSMWTDPDVRRYLWDDLIISKDTAARVVRDAMETASKHGIGHWTMRLGASGPVIGDCGFRFIDETPEIELMFPLLKPYWGAGLAVEASQAALQYLWRATAFGRVYARTDIPNERSVRTMQRLGMRYDSTQGPLVCYVLDRPSNVIG